MMLSGLVVAVLVVTALVGKAFAKRRGIGG